MIPLTYSDVINLRMDECCKNLLTDRAADTIRRNFIECLQPFGIKFKDNLTWLFENIKISQNSSEDILIEIYIRLEKCGQFYGEVTYFNDGGFFYFIINIPKGYYVYDSSKDILTKATHANCSDFIRKVKNAYNDFFDAEELWRKGV